MRPCATRPSACRSSCSPARNTALVPRAIGRPRARSCSACAQSFERIHRSNLVGMGVVPLVFEEGTSWQTLGLKGDEQVTLRGLHTDLKPHQRLVAEIVPADGGLKRVPLICRIDTADELDYFRNGGILQYVLRRLAA